METLKSIGGCLLYILGGVLLLTVTVCFFLGAEWVSVHVLPWMMYACVVVTGILFLILLPLSAIKKARGFTAVAILLISYVFGVSVWMEGFLVTMTTWGVMAVIVGLCFFGVGVVPIGMLAALFHGQWSELFDLIILMALTFGCRFFAIWIDGKNQEYKSRREYETLLETSPEEEP